MCLSDPLYPVNYKDDISLFEDSYKIFDENLRNIEKRPRLWGKKIFIDCTNFADDGRELSYWHICSIGADDSKYDMYPCLNDSAGSKCQYKCDVDHEENFLKDKNGIPCVYRASKIIWLIEILRLANLGGSRYIKIWKTQNKKTRQVDLLIRYESEIIDYVIIFKIQNAESEYPYRFKTAFPIVLKSYKRRYDKEYINYTKTK